jgi:hypothetical protein
VKQTLGKKISVLFSATTTTTQFLVVTNKQILTETLQILSLLFLFFFFFFFLSLKPQEDYLNSITHMNEPRQNQLWLYKTNPAIIL